MSRSQREPKKCKEVDGDDSSPNVKGDHIDGQTDLSYTSSTGTNLLTSSQIHSPPPSPQCPHSPPPQCPHSPPPQCPHSPPPQCPQSPPPQCSTPISIMYDFLAHHNLPCKYKSTFEFNAQKCLLTLGDRSGEERGDRGKMTSHLREQRRKKKQSKRFPVKGEAAVTPQSCTEHSKDDEMQESMTSEEMFARIIVLLSPKLMAEGFGQWQTCPTSHYLSVKEGIPDYGFYFKDKPACPTRRNSNILSQDDPSMCQRGRQTNSASGRLGVKRGSSTLRVMLGNKGGRGSRPSSSEITEKDLWQEMEVELQPVYSFKHFKHTQQYADQYREVYTYTKLREKSIMAISAAKILKASIPRAGLVCYKSVNRNVKGLAGSKLTNSSKGQTSTASDREESSTKWQMNPRLKDACDPHLSVNNPSPTELTVLGKMPVIRRSSPSIPSNTNGKYGGRGSSRLYPFQLQISTETRTVSSPYKRLPRSLLG